jgi:hypothetical protein
MIGASSITQLGIQHGLDSNDGYGLPDRDLSCGRLVRLRSFSTFLLPIFDYLTFIVEEATY